MDTKWAFSLRYIDTELDRPRWRTTLSYRVLSSLQLGLEYNPAAGEFAPLATWFLSAEKGLRPAAFLGTSSDRIGSPEGTQSYFLTVAKSLGALPVSVYGSVNYSEWDESLNFPFGAYLEVAPGYTLQPMYDGERTHLLGMYATRRFSVTLIYAWLEEAGIAASVGF